MIRWLRSLLNRPPSSLDYGSAWCDCGAQIADDRANRRWDCSDILLGRAVEKGQPGTLRHSNTYPAPYAFWKVPIDDSGMAPTRRKPRNQPDRSTGP